MALNPIVDMMREAPLFAWLDDEPLKLIAFGGERITRRAGYRLFTEGAPAYTGFLVLHGSVELKQAAVSVALAFPGDLIGELALIQQIKRPATAVMREDGELLEIPRIAIQRVMDEYPQVASIIRRTLATRLADMSREFQVVRAGLLALDGKADEPAPDEPISRKTGSA